MDEKAFQSALATAVAILAVKPRSIADFTARLNRKLQKRHPEPAERNELLKDVLARLQEYGYLNDERFADQFAQGRVARSAVGKRRLKQDLTRQKVEKEVIEQAVEQVYETVSEAEVMERVVFKYVQSHGLPSTPQAVKRLMGMLIRRGFPYDLVVGRARQLARAARLEAAEEDFSADGDGDPDT